MRNGLNNAGDALGSLLATIVAGIPEFLGALLILLVGYFVAKTLGKVVDGALDKVDLDGRLHGGQGGNILQKTVPHPSNLIGSIVFWLVFLFAISVAVSVLGIPALSLLIAGVYAYIPNVIAAFLIFLVAGAASGAVAGLVGRAMGDTATGKVLGTAAPVVIMSIAGFMILNQLKIAPEIVTITYAALLGSVGLGMALAFGLGGRDAAARVLSNIERKAQENKSQVSSDLQVGKTRIPRTKKEITPRF